MKNILKLNTFLITLVAGFILAIIFIIVIAVCGYKMGEAYVNEQANKCEQTLLL